MNDETYRIDRRGMNEHATQRAEGRLHGSRAPTGLALAGESGCAVG